MKPIRFADVLAHLRLIAEFHPVADVARVERALIAARPRHARYRLRRADGSERVIRVRTLSMMEVVR